MKNRLTAKRIGLIREFMLGGRTPAYVAAMLGLTVEQVDRVMFGGAREGTIEDRLMKLKRDEVIWPNWDEMAIALECAPSSLQTIMPRLPWPQQQMIRERMNLMEYMYWLRETREQRRRVVRFVGEWWMKTGKAPTRWTICSQLRITRPQLARLFSAHGNPTLASTRIWRLAGLQPPDRQARYSYDNA